MRLTEAVRYAMKLMEYMARKEKGIVVSRVEVSENANIPKHFLAKIAQDLKKNGLLDIRQGSTGGFVLTCDVEETTLGDITKAMIGPVDIGFKFDKKTKLGDEIQMINNLLIIALSDVTLDVVVEDGQG